MLGSEFVVNGQEESRPKLKTSGLKSSYQKMTSVLTRTNEPVRHDPGHAAFFMTCEIELNTKNSTRRAG